MIAAIRSSGRERSNSSLLLDAALEAAGDTPRRLFNLAGLPFRGCTGCGACRKGAPGCVLEDGLTPVLEAVASADALFLAAPNYYGYVSGIFKSFLDRWYGFRDAERNLRMPPGRNLLFFFSQGHPDPEAYAPVRDQMEKIFRGYGFLPSVLVAGGLERPGEVLKREDLLGEARRLGRLAAARGPA